MKYGIKNNIRIFYREGPTEGGSSHDDIISENIEKKQLLDALIKSKNPEEAKRILQQYNTQRDDYEKITIDTDTLLFDTDQKPINRDPNNYALQELAYNLGIHEKAKEFIQQRIRKLTKQIYEDVLKAPTRATLTKYENSWQSLFIGDEYLPLWTNIRTLSYDLHNIAQSSGTPNEQTTRKRIENSLGIADNSQYIEFRTQKENPNTYITLAEKLIPLIHDGTVIGNLGDQLIDWYTKNSPDYFRDRALTMIQVARKVSPSKNISTSKGDTPEDTTNNLHNEILLNTLLQSIDSDTIGTIGVGNDDIMSEYDTLDQTQKEQLAKWSPKATYKMLLTRYNELLSGGNVRNPIEIVDAVRKVLMSHPSFRLTDKPALMRMYETIFSKFLALINSGLADTEAGKQAILGMTDAVNAEDDISHLMQEFNKSVTTRGGFGLDDKNKLKFISARDIKKGLSDGILSQGEIQALRGYFTDIKNPVEARAALTSTIGDTPLDQSTFAEFLDKNASERKKLISDANYQVLQGYFGKQGLTGGNIDGIRNIPITKIQEQYDIDFNELFNGIPGVNKIDSIPMNSDNTPNLPLLLKSLLQQGVSLESCTKVKDILKQTLGKLIGKNDIELTQRRTELLRLFPELGSDPKVSKIFKIIGIITTVNTDPTVLELEHATTDTLKEYQTKLLEKKGTANEGEKKIIDALLGYIKSIGQGKGLQRSYTGMTRMQPEDLQSAAKNGDTRNFVNNSIVATGAKDIPQMENELNSIIQKNSELLKRHGLPTSIEEYHNNQNLRTKIADILASSNLTPEERTAIESIRDRTESLKAKEKSIISAVDGLKKGGYTATLVNYSDATEFIQSIPPKRLAQYQNELGITPSQGTPTGLKTILLSSLPNYTPTSIANIEGFSGFNLDAIKNSAIIQKVGDTYSIQVKDPADPQKEYPVITDVKEGELKEKLQDTNTLAKLKAYSLIPQMDLIRTLIGQNTARFSNIQATGEYTQSSIQLITAVELLLGRDIQDGQDIDTRTRAITNSKSSGDITNELTRRGIIQDGSINKSMVSALILEKPPKIEEMNDDALMLFFLPKERQDMIGGLCDTEKAKIIGDIRADITSLRASLGEVNSQTIEAYRQVLEHTF